MRVWGSFSSSNADTAQCLKVSHVGVEERSEFGAETWGGVCLVIEVILGAVSSRIIRWVELPSSSANEGNWVEIPKSTINKFLRAFLWVFGGELRVNFSEFF